MTGKVSHLASLLSRGLLRDVIKDRLPSSLPSPPFFMGMRRKRKYGSTPPSLFHRTSLPVDKTFFPFSPLPSRGTSFHSLPFFPRVLVMLTTPARRRRTLLSVPLSLAFFWHESTVSLGPLPFLFPLPFPLHVSGSIHVDIIGAEGLLPVFFFFFPPLMTDTQNKERFQISPSFLPPP